MSGTLFNPFEGPESDGVWYIPDPDIPDEPLYGHVELPAAGGFFLVQGELNVLFGNEGLGKTWIALEVAIRWAQTGRPVYILTEEVNRTVKNTMRLLGAWTRAPRGLYRIAPVSELATQDSRRGTPEDAILRAPDPQGLLPFERLTRDICSGPADAFVLIDTASEAGLSHDGGSVRIWHNKITDVLLTRGHTVMILDHPPKGSEHAKTMSGSRQKSARIKGVSWRLKRGKVSKAGGVIELELMKDKHAVTGLEHGSSLFIRQNPGPVFEFNVEQSLNEIMIGLAEDSTAAADSIVGVLTEQGRTMNTSELQDLIPGTKAKKTEVTSAAGGDSRLRRFRLKGNAIYWALTDWPDDPEGETI